jgi:hypothetical protein
MLDTIIHMRTSLALSKSAAATAGGACGGIPHARNRTVCLRQDLIKLQGVWSLWTSNLEALFSSFHVGFYNF